MARIAIIRIRGIINVDTDIQDTLTLLRLHKKNVCVVREQTPSLMGMVKKAGDYITWGEVSDDIYNKMVDARGEKQGKELKPFFRLSPPKKGYGRAGIKKPFKVGGALGYRGEKINDLILRMI